VGQVLAVILALVTGQRDRPLADFLHLDRVLAADGPLPALTLHQPDRETLVQELGHGSKLRQ